MMINGRPAPMTPSALGVRPDARLSAGFLSQAFLWMFVGLLLTAGVAWLVGTNESLVAGAAFTPASADDKKEDPKIIVPYVPTHPKVVNAMLKLAAVKEGETVYDLGCGDGRIVIAADASRAGCERCQMPNSSSASSAGPAMGFMTMASRRSSAPQTGC